MDNWKFLFKEEKGAVQGKVWVTNGEFSALFKPDSDRNESRIEYETYQIAKALSIPHAKTEVIELFGQKGVLSYDFKYPYDPNLIFVPADGLYIKSDNLTFKSRDTSNNRLNRISKLSLQRIKETMPQLEKDMVNMLFLDCLISNRDRHGNNWEIVMNRNADILALAPLFDHNMAMENSYSDMLDYSMVLYADGEMELKHFDMFKRLSKEYPNQIKTLLKKAQKVQLNDFVLERFKKMQEI